MRTMLNRLFVRPSSRSEDPDAGKTIHDLAAAAARSGNPVWQMPDGAHQRWLGRFSR